MSRACTVCPKASMRDDVRHLHELEEGARFRFVDELAPDLRLVAITPASCLIASPPTTRHKRIVPRFADPVEFDQVDHGIRRCAPSAQVVPV